MAQVDDALAVNDFMKRTPAKTEEAKKLQNAFFTWYNNSSWWDKNVSSDWFDELRTRRNQFNLANAVTTKEKAAVVNVLEHGMTAEQMQGKARPPVNSKTGAVGSQISNPTTVKGVGKLTRNLKKGVSGNDVKTWQTFLGLTPATGYFDGLTDTKTRAYQAEHGLKVDGIVGPKSWDAAFAQQKEPSSAITDDFSVAPTTVAALKASSLIGKPAAAPKLTADVAVQAAKIVASKSPPKKTASAPAEVVHEPLKTAGMAQLPDWFNKLSTTEKILGGLGVAAAVFFGAKHQHVMAKGHH